MSENAAILASERGKRAKHVVNVMGDVSAIFSSCIRTIRNAEATHTPDDPKLAEIVAQGATFLVGVSPSLKSMLYCAAIDIHPKEMEAAQLQSLGDLLRSVRPSELSAILGLGYLYRRVKKRCPEAEWKRVHDNLHIHVAIGALVGDTVKYVGAGNGMLMAGLRFLALALFPLRDLKGFQEHQRKLKSGSRLFDLDAEEKRWGCTHLDVAALLATSMGFGKQVGYGLSSKLFSVSHLDAGITHEMEEAVSCWRCAMEYAQALHETGEPPPPSDAAPRYLSEDEINELKSACDLVKQSGSAAAWLDATKAQVPETLLVPLELAVAPKGEDSAADGDLDESTAEGAG